MRKLLILPGNSKKNKEWGEKCQSAFAEIFEDITCSTYDHWLTEDQDQVIDFDVEIYKIKNVFVTSERSDEWFIFAKSIGTILALILHQKNLVSPTKSVFFGMPLEIANDLIFKNNWSLLESYSVPTLAFHNDEDPTANYKFTQSKLEKYAPSISLKTLSGNNHEYLDFNQYKSVVMSFLE